MDQATSQNIFMFSLLILETNRITRVSTCNYYNFTEYYAYFSLNMLLSRNWSFPKRLNSWIYAPRARPRVERKVRAWFNWSYTKYQFFQNGFVIFDSILWINIVCHIIPIFLPGVIVRLHDYVHLITTDRMKATFIAIYANSCYLLEWTLFGVIV